MTALPRCNTIIFDLGDVLFTWSSKTTTSISPKVLHQILRTSTWFEFECGRISEDECYERVGIEFSIPPGDIREAFLQARMSLQGDEDMISTIEELKAQSSGRLRVYAMSNISAPDFAFLRTRPAKWEVFDEVFTSAAAGSRKPHLTFYNHVLEKTGADPCRTIFVDDKAENVLTARSLGIHGLVYSKETRDEVKRALRNLTSSPTLRGRQYMLNNAGFHHSTMDNGVTIKENFAQLLIYELTADRDLVYFSDMPRAWNFFCDKAPHTQDGDFPFDLDTTSLGLTICQQDKEVINSVMDEMLQYVDPDGISLTYFDNTRPRIDPIVCVNVLTLFYSYGRGSDIPKSYQWVYNVLLNRAYLDGTRYYATPEAFLYFLTRLITASPHSPELRDDLEPLLRVRVQERLGAPGDALALAMRIITCNYLGIPTDGDLRTLLTFQASDGGWEIGWIYKFGGSGILIGNRGLTTAFALKAIQLCTTQKERPPSPPLTPVSPTPRTQLRIQIPSPTAHLEQTTLRSPRSKSPILTKGRNWAARLSFRSLKPEKIVD